MMSIVEFNCHKYHADDGVFTMFFFYVDGMWDNHKSTLAEGLERYPLNTYEWLFIGEDDE